MSKLKLFLTKNEISSLKKLQKAIHENQITITCVGLYNHGKSTLLNVLIKDFEYKTFKTADARETTLNKSVAYHNIKYVDTPGLNAQEKDDRKVMEAIENSDITLFVHNVTTGEFNKAEMDFLTKIQKHWKNSQEFLNRTVFVLSRIDNINNYEDIQNTNNKMQKQIKEIFDSDCLIIPVSSADYREGILENEEELIDESNIKKLEEKIEFLSRKLEEEIINTKKERFEYKFYELHLKMNNKIKENQQKISVLTQQQKAIDDNVKNDIEKIERTLKNMYKQLKDI
ncbi:50S ribosome-binding GTPase [bacterium]|nr:50S ribosome-binding GTPase [bacterium]MBU1957400.1 50S ribosome-binding GTPase [bacterium]